MVQHIAAALFAAFLMSLASGNVAADSQPRALIVMDGSGSMWGQIAGVPKLEIARQTLTTVLSGLPNDLELGLVAYGHREKGNCGDIELIVPPAAGTATAISQAAGSMRFLGKTPLSAAVQMAAEELRYTEDAATVILITDGVETCEADPCALASALENSGVGFTAHVIGFGLSGEDGAQVACIAENTGGRYLPANNAEALADALTAAISDDLAASPAAPDPETPEPSRYFPGAEIMPNVALTPTGYNLGEPLPHPRERSFPAEGTTVQCQAMCTGDSDCGSWRYEPKGSMFVEHARCFLFSPSTEFNITFYPQTDGWASGMKDGVIGLTRPYVPLGAEDIAASLSVPEPVPPGSEFTVLWSGPGGDGDWVDIVPAGYTELSGEISYFYVNETIEEGDLPEGAGLLTAPSEPGLYDLRYILGRPTDRRAILTVPITIGGDGPATARSASGSASLVPVEATFSADTGGLDLAVSWSATPVPGQGLPPEAWAMPKSVIGSATEQFLPGRYDILGDAGDSVFAAQVEITPSGPNDFLIPHSDRLSPAGEDQAGVYSCARTDPCRIEDATGLSFALPAGWRTNEVFIAETAGGVRALYPTVTFISADGSDVITLNPLRWLESSGTCSAIAMGELCIHGLPSGEALLAYSIILPSLIYRSQEVRTPDFGGQSFVPPAGEKALAVLVPGWGG